MKFTKNLTPKTNNSLVLSNLSSKKNPNKFSSQIIKTNNQYSRNKSTNVIKLNTCKNCDTKIISNKNFFKLKCGYIACLSCLEKHMKLQILEKEEIIYEVICICNNIQCNKLAIDDYYDKFSVKFRICYDKRVKNIKNLRFYMLN